MIHIACTKSVDIKRLTSGGVNSNIGYPVVNAGIRLISNKVKISLSVYDVLYFRLAVDIVARKELISDPITVRRIPRFVEGVHEI